jgi:thiol-disulfide isomerase/thioredoxin
MKIISKILQLLLAVTFLFSAYTKAIGPGFFEITLMDQGLAPNRAFAGHMARFFIGLEFALGGLMLFPFYVKRLMQLSFLMLGGFTIHLIYLWSTGDTENCGCFGEMISMTPEQSILKNLVMLAVAYIVYKTALVRTLPKAIPMGFSVLTLLSMWLLLPLPDHDNFPFESFTHFEPKGRVDLSQGQNLIAVFNLDCEHCQEAATALGELERKYPNFPNLYVLFFREGATTVADFEGITRSSFPYDFIDVNTFFDLIGDAPPRIYFLDEGEVAQIWDSDFSQNITTTFGLEP